MREAKVMEQEDYVRSRWQETILGGLYLYESTRSYHLRLGPWEHKGNVKDKDTVWQAAYAFTLERERQIKDVEEEHELIFQKREAASHKPAHQAIYARILARLQSTSADLRKGMRDE